MTIYIVWNESKTEGFVTKDAALAYEVRKSAASNCYHSDGTPSKLGMAFCDLFADDNCTIEEIEGI